MQLFFTNSEIIWKEFQYPFGILVFCLTLIVFASLGFLLYKNEFYISFTGSLGTILVLFYTGWIGSGCNSDLNLTLNKEKRTGVIADNLSKTTYELTEKDIQGYLKREFTKTENKKTKNYHQLFLLLKNGAVFNLKESSDFDEIKKLIGNLKKEFPFPVYFSAKDIPVELQSQPVTTDSLCNIKFEEIQAEKYENACRLTWKIRTPGYLYVLIAFFLNTFLIWLDSVIKNGFSLAHFIGFIFVFIFSFAFGYLGLQKWDSKGVLILEDNKILTYMDTRVFGKHREASIQVQDIKLISSQIETTQDSMVLSNMDKEKINQSDDLFELIFHANYVIVPVYGLPVVDKLRLCDLIRKAQGY